MPYEFKHLQDVTNCQNVLITIWDDGTRTSSDTIPGIKRITEEFINSYAGNIPFNFAITTHAHTLYSGNSNIDNGFMGATHRSLNLIVLNASQLDCKKDVTDTLRHEVLGHYGLLTFSPEDKKELLDAVLATRTSKDPSLQKIWTLVDKNYSHLTEFLDTDYHKAEEVFSFIAQEKEEFFKDSWAKVRAIFMQLLRKCGLVDKDLTAPELRVEALKVAEGIRTGQRQQQIFPQDDMQLFCQKDMGKERHTPPPSQAAPAPTPAPAKRKRMR